MPFDRRQFLKTSTQLAAGAIWPGVGLYSQPHPAEPAAFHFADVMQVRPEGWLKLYLQKQAKLAYALPDFSDPFTRQFWQGEERAESWWPWEQKAYWIDGALRCAILLQDSRLMERASAPVRYTLSHVGEGGYLGPAYLRPPARDDSRWPHAVFFRSLFAWYEAGSKDVIERMSRHFLRDDASYSTPLRNVVNVESMLWCYQHSRDHRLLALAEESFSRFLAVAAEYKEGDFTRERLRSGTPINAHGVTYAELSKLPAMLFAATGKKDYLDLALASQARVFAHHMLVDGIPSTTEFFRTTTSVDGHETCDIADFTWTWGYYLHATQDGIWADYMERACFNAGMGAISKDWKSLQYFSSPNQFVAAAGTNQERYKRGNFMMQYAPNPGRRVACCAGNVHRILPNYVLRMWATEPDDTIVACLYGPSRFETTLPLSGAHVTIQQATAYPFEESIEFRIGLSHRANLSLRLRIPAWCKRPRLAVNGVPHPLGTEVRGFVTLRRTFETGDRVRLDLPQETALSFWPDSGVAYERGPMVYSMPIRQEISTLVDAPWSSASFPSTNRIAAAEWRFGIQVQSNGLPSLGSVETFASSDDPWETPPVHLQVSARKIESWAMDTSVDGSPLTPQLPVSPLQDVDTPLEKITLQPLGSTTLRLTVFPQLPANHRVVGSNAADV